MSEKWFLMSVADIEKKLKTNAAQGLSRKAARARVRNENGSIFSRPRRSALSLAGDLVSDFALIMLCLMSVIAICFGEHATGVTLTVIIAVDLAVAFVIYYRNEGFLHSIEGFFVPRSKVIRDGKLYAVSPGELVVGDVIMLSEGDVLACDARLVSSDGLKVKMLVERGKYLMLDKVAQGVVAENENDVTKLSSMVHAGSVVVDGSARAIVTALGRYTYIGAREGSIAKSSAPRQVPRILKLFKKYCSSLGLVLLFTVLPFSVLGLLIGGKELSLFTVFITALAMATTSMAQFAVTVYKIFFTFRIRKNTMSRDPSVIRSAEVLDKLASAQYVFIMDGSALGDGVLHLDSAFVAEGEIKIGDGRGKSERCLVDLATLYDSAQKSSLSTGAQSYGRYDCGIKEFVEKMHGDRDALGIRCAISGFSAANSTDPHDKLFYTDLGKKYILCVSYDDSVVSECDAVLVGGEESNLSESGREMIRHKYRGYLSDGKRVLIFSRILNLGYGKGAGRCFVGMLAFSETASTTAQKAMSALQKNGLKPVLFKNTSVGGRVPDVSRIPPSVPCEPTATQALFFRQQRPIWYNFGKYPCYSGFEDTDVCELIKFLHGKDKRVAVIGFCERYEAIYREADVFVSCSSERYSSGQSQSEVEALYSRDDPSSVDTPQVLKQTADIIVPRPGKKGVGGVASLLSAFRSAGIAYGNIANFFRYVICVQFIRIFLCLLPMLFGSVALDARHILLGGMVIDMFVMLSFAADSCVRETPVGYRGILNEFSSPIQNNAGMIISFGGGALFAAVLPELFSLFPFAPKYIDKTEYSLIVFVLLHLSAFCAIKLDSVRKYGFKSINRAAVIIPVAALIFLALCFSLGGLERAFGIEGFTSMHYLFLTPVPAVLSIIVYVFIGDLRLHKHASK